MRGNRDEFTETTKRKLSGRVAYMCSNPLCRRLTAKRCADTDGVVHSGMASHIHAAAPGGPRSDPSMTASQRKSPQNGIWLCNICGHEVDRNRAKYPAAKLRRWKDDAESYVETLHTQDSRLRQLRMIATDLLSSIRLLTAIPGPGNDLDQTFRTAGQIPVSRVLIEVEQTLFENGFRTEADRVFVLYEQIMQLEALMRRKPSGTCLDISAWKDRAVKDLMLKVMRFSPGSFDRYLARERSMVRERLGQLEKRQVIVCSSHLQAPDISAY